MAINDKNKITLGIGVLELGDYDAAGVVFQGYRDIGAITGTLTIKHENEVRRFESGRPLRPIVQHKIREAVMVEFSFAELNLSDFKSILGSGITSSNTTSAFLSGSLLVSTGGLSAASSSLSAVNQVFEFGGAPEHNSAGIRFTHVKQNAKRIVFEGFIASPSGNLALPFNESDYNIATAEFTLLADTARADGKQFYRMIQEL